jgi:hypothetical protein
LRKLWRATIGITPARQPRLLPQRRKKSPSAKNHGPRGKAGPGFLAARVYRSQPECTGNGLSTESAVQALEGGSGRGAHPNRPLRPFLSEVLPIKRDQERVRHEATPTPARGEMPVLPQRWLGFRQAEGAPRRPISLHGCNALRRARPSPSKGPRRVWSLGRGGEWALVVLD